MYIYINSFQSVENHPSIFQTLHNFVISMKSLWKCKVCRRDRFLNPSRSISQNLSKFEVEHGLGMKVLRTKNISNYGSSLVVNYFGSMKCEGHIIWMETCEYMTENIQCLFEYAMVPYLNKYYIIIGDVGMFFRIQLFWITGVGQ